MWLTGTQSSSTRVTTQSSTGSSATSASSTATALGRNAFVAPPPRRPVPVVDVTQHPRGYTVPRGLLHLKRGTNAPTTAAAATAGAVPVAPGKLSGGDEVHVPPRRLRQCRVCEHLHGDRVSRGRHELGRHDEHCGAKGRERKIEHQAAGGHVRAVNVARGGRRRRGQDRGCSGTRSTL